MDKIEICLIVTILVLLVGHAEVHSFEVGTHVEVSDRAVRSSNLDNVLTTQLNLLQGIDSPLSISNKAIGWVRLGSLREDDSLRFVNHFHNPLRSWDEAGLQVLGLPVLDSRSSILWGQNVGQGFTWQDARQSYFQALTFQGLADKIQATREARLADTFRALGQLIHLVQDAAVPAHTRNDPHPIFDGFESFVESTRNTNWTLFEQLTSRVTRVDPAILALLPNPLAPIPIARIIDTTDPEQADATPSAGTNVGMAEYSNANFLSGDTIFKDFAFPPVGSLGNPFDATDPTTGSPRSYFPKVSDGETAFRLAAKGVWTEILASRWAGDQGYILDNGVYEDYARLLLPRAIGYSAGLLDYFFRGQIEIAAPDRFLYGRTNYREPFQAMDLDKNVNAFTQLRFKVRNATPNEETSCPAGQECLPPQLFAVVQYRTGGGADLIKAPQTKLSDALSFAVSQPLAVAPTRNFQEFTFDFSGSPLPANVADVFLTVVYRGPLGLERDAVMVGGKDLFEPTPLINANGTDYFCFNGALQHVGDLSAFPPFDLLHPLSNPPQPRDPTGDGVPDLLGPEDELSVSVKVAAGVTDPSGSNVDLLPLPQRTSGQYVRFTVLQDQPTFVLSELATSVVDYGLAPQRVDSNVRVSGLYPANKNRLVVGPSGTLDHQFLPSRYYRGVLTTQFSLLIHQPVADFLPCFADSATGKSITPIDSPVVGP